jgi:S1-C subfamily serine protease
MSWDESMTILRDVLAALYPTVPDSLTVVRSAQLPSAQIAFSPAAITNWQSILDEALKRHKVPDIVGVARKQYPENEELRLAQQGDLKPVRGPQIGDEVPWQGPADVDPLEKIMGSQSTLVPVSFLEIGLLRARAVGRVVRADGSRGSGFLVSNDLLVTNHHVLKDAERARGAVVQFSG